MVSIAKFCAGLVVAVQLSGCTSLTVTSPANNATVKMPQELTVTENVGLDGRTGALKVSIDGVDAERFSNVNFSVPSGSTLCCLPPGPHTVSASGQTSSATVTASSTFTVDSAADGCPGCYTGCPAGGKVHPVFGVCCDNGACDTPATSNFGPWRFPTTTCPTPQVRRDGCINQNAQALCGANGAGCSGLSPMATQMVAVSFQPVQGGRLKQIQVPIGHRSGGNAYQAWITTDAGGRPGSVVEAFALNNVRAQPASVRAPVHIFSAATPTLTAGTTYWLVIGPAAQNAAGSWNIGHDDTPSAGSANYLVNVTPDANGIPQLSGPWLPAGGLLRPAFQVDLR